MREAENLIIGMPEKLAQEIDKRQQNETSRARETLAEKFENSFDGTFVIPPSIHDLKIIKPKGMTREEKFILLGLRSIELVCAVINTYSIGYMALNGSRLIIAGAEGNNPAETVAGFGTLTASAILSPIPFRGFKEFSMAVREILDSSSGENHPPNKLALQAYDPLVKEKNGQQILMGDFTIAGC